VATHLPSRWTPSAEAEARITTESGGFRPPPGIVLRATGITGRHVMPDDWQASDLAVAAAAKLLADQGLDVTDVDLLLFASASQDLVEPATSHIVAASLGARCPVFDVKNACNSVLNAIQVAEALIRTGQHERVLVVTGESPSRATRWQVRDLRQLAESFAGYTLSDCGAALLLEACDDGEGVLAQGHRADSTAWTAGTLPGGGSRRPRDLDATYFHLDGARLKAAFEAIGPEVLTGVLDDAGITWRDCDLVAVHQVTLPYVHAFADRCGIDRDRLEITVAEHGNCASATLPLQLERAVQTGRVERGSLVALVGLAGGISVGTVVLRW
jgi:3-oxoacyl-[acyl-carrier-protein] synthase-3